MTAHDFPGTAQRAAVHCDALMRRRAAPAELVPGFERLGERLAAALGRAVAAAWSDPLAEARSLGVRELGCADLAEACGPLPAASAHGFGRSGRALFVAVDGRGLLEQLDRAFGGTGDIGDQLPAALSSSADLLARRLERQVASTLSTELGGIAFEEPVRGGEFAKIVPFATDAALALLSFEILPADRRPLRIVLAIETEALEELLPHNAVPRPSRVRRETGPGVAPFSELPLEVSATLVDMSVPISRLAGLAPGAVLPITVARSVPLHIGDAIVARGTVGEIDDHAAIEITQAFSGKDQ